MSNDPEPSAFLIIEDQDEDSGDPLYDCSGELDGGTCLVHRKTDGIYHRLTQGDASSRPAKIDEYTVHRVYTEVATASLKKQLLVGSLLDLFEVTEEDRRASVFDSVLPDSRAAGWPLLPDMRGEFTDVFDVIQKHTDSRKVPPLCTDVTLVPFWVYPSRPTNTRFRPTVLCSVLESGVTKRSELQDQHTSTWLGTASAPDSALIPFGYTVCRTAEGRRKFVFALHPADFHAMQGLRDPGSVIEYNPNDSNELVMEHKMAKSRNNFRPSHF